MRCLGEISGRKSAERLVAHLLTQDVSTHIEAKSAGLDQWEIWVRDEDKLDRAAEELALYRSNPDDPKYAAAIVKATGILTEKEKARKQVAKNIRRMETVVRPNMVGRGPMPPLTLTLLILCIVIGLLSNFMRPGQSNDWGLTAVNQLSFVQFADFQQSGGNPAASIEKGEIWRIVTPIFLHGDPLHLAMNMLGLVIFGRVLERLMGTTRYAMFVLVLAVVPNLLQGLLPEALGGSPHFVGISGVIYGFFGYIWVRSSMNPLFGIRIPFAFIVIAVGMIVIGLSGAVENWPYADICHLGGLVVGAAFGFASEQGESKK